MKIEEVVPDATLAVTDAYDVEAGIPEEGYQLLGEHNDVHNFQTVADTMAVKVEKTHIDLAVDTNMNGKIESLPDNVNPVQGWPDNDRQLDDANPPHAVVIDVNNNNTDSGVAGSGTSGEVDNANARLDTEADRTEMTSTRDGHSFGSLRVFVHPIEKVKNSELSLRLSFADPAQADTVRVFDWQAFDDGEHLPLELLGPGKTSCTLDPSSFFGEGFNPSKLTASSYRTLLVEGLTYGTVTLKLDLLKGSGEEVQATDEVKVTVNVDRVAQAPGDVAGKKDARPLRGLAPHHIGIRKTDLTTGDGIRAIRGTFALRVAGANGKSRLSPMTKNLFRGSKDNTLEQSSGASFWIGLAERESSGSLRQWVQTGVRWVQPARSRFGSVPAIYLETGDLYGMLGAKSIGQIINGGDPQMLGGGVTSQTTQALENWETSQIRYSFVLFKEVVDTNEAGEDKTVSPWQLVVRDQRAIPETNSNYSHIKISNPTVPGSVGDAARDELNRRYRAQKFRALDALFETNQTISFAAGSPDQHGTISEIHIATAYSGQPPESPNPNSLEGKVQLYDWAQAAYAWEAVPTAEGDLEFEPKTGRSLGDGSAEQGSVIPPNWNATIPTGGGIEIWDNRPYGFGQQN